MGMELEEVMDAMLELSLERSTGEAVFWVDSSVYKQGSCTSGTTVSMSFSAIGGERSSTNESRSHSSSAKINNNTSPISTVKNPKSGLKKPPPLTKGRNKAILSQNCRALVFTRSSEGKKIDGYLYQCSEKAVRILCDCHGSIFTPAGFVKHAGGPNTKHPLRLITVVPS